jgi:virginiamycin B lyase
MTSLDDLAAGCDPAWADARACPKRPRGRRTLPHRRRVRPAVECLEGRSLLAAITEFPLSSTSDLPGSLTQGSDGNLWFPDIHSTGQFTPSDSSIGRITPAGAVTDFPLPSLMQVQGPLTEGSDGNLWFLLTAGFEEDSIGRITPAGVVTEFPFPSVIPAYSSLTLGPDGNLWFFADSQNIGRITPAGVVTEFPLPSDISSSSLGSLTVGPDGNLWFPVTSPNEGYIGRITPAGAITDYPIPSGAFAVSALTVGPDGNLWFGTTSDSLPNRGIDRITPAGVVTVFPLVSSDFAVGGALTVGPDGNLWFPENVFVKGFDESSICRITPAGVVTEFPLPIPPGNQLPESGNQHSEPGVLTVGPDGNLYLGESLVIQSHIQEFPENVFARVDRITPSGDVIVLPSVSSKSFTSDTLTVGAEGSLWFGEPGFIGRLDPAQISPSTIGPTVLALQGGGPAQPTQLVITFSGELDPGRAAKSSEYTIRSLSLGGRPRAIRVVRAAYDPGTHSVTLRTRSRLSTNATYATYQVTIKGTPPRGLTSASGSLFLDGDDDGIPGGNFVGSF